jgi:hypothetical protein
VWVLEEHRPQLRLLQQEQLVRQIPLQRVQELRRCC